MVTGQSGGGNFSVEVPSSQACQSLCQVDQNLSGTPREGSQIQALLCSGEKTTRWVSWTERCEPVETPSFGTREVGVWSRPAGSLPKLESLASGPQRTAVWCLQCPGRPRTHRPGPGALRCFPSAQILGGGCDGEASGCARQLEQVLVQMCAVLGVVELDLSSSQDTVKTLSCLP